MPRKVTLIVPTEVSYDSEEFNEEIEAILPAGDYEIVSEYGDTAEVAAEIHGEITVVEVPNDSLIED
jgi:hypothetical protein